MRDPINTPYQWTGQRLLFACWFAVLIAVVVVIAHPASIGILRVFIAAAIPILWLVGIVLLRRIKQLAVSVFVLGLAGILFALLPGRPIESATLRQTYTSHLRRYENAPYVWGGENRRGIDCSGLVRRALITSYTQLAITTLNPHAVRTAIDMWWHDCTARALRDRYRNFTTPLFAAPAINSITHSLLMPGDIAVTSNGCHVLAYLGDHQWIEADPGILRVVTVTVPTDNMWFTVPVHIMRWTEMTENPIR